MSMGDDHGRYPEDGGIGGTGQTRTRLPEGPASTDGYGGGRRATRPSRSMITVVGVVVLLVAAIAFANRGDGGDEGGTPGSGGKPGASSTAASGVKPVEGKNGGIASGFARDEQGAQSAAANFAVALVSAEILKPDRRPDIVRQVFVADKVGELTAKFDQAYGKTFLDKIGLDENGNAPEGMTYVSRTAPIGTKVTKSSDTSTTVEVWCTGVFGTAGVSSTNPVTSDWFTMTLALRWANNDWKVESFSQKDGPAPVSADRTASNADEISKAVQDFGGFTYAR